jgi:hypothetical protein
MQTFPSAYTVEKNQQVRGFIEELTLTIWMEQWGIEFHFER